MPSRITDNSITVWRDNKAHQVPRGQPFDFTDEEVSEITTALPNALRRPINESPSRPVDTGNTDPADRMLPTQPTRAAAPVPLTPPPMVMEAGSPAEVASRPKPSPINASKPRPGGSVKPVEDETL